MKPEDLSKLGTEKSTQIPVALTKFDHMAILMIEDCIFDGEFTFRELARMMDYIGFLLRLEALEATAFLEELLKSSPNMANAKEVIDATAKLGLSKREQHALLEQAAWWSKYFMRNNPQADGEKK